MRFSLIALCLGSLQALLLVGSPAADCIHYADYIHWVASADTPGDVYSVATADGYAYVAAGHCLYVVDVTEPREPEVVSCVPGVGYFDVFISGSYAYTADFGYGMHVIDIRDPRNPIVVGNLGSWGGKSLFVYTVAAAGDYAYIGNWNLNTWPYEFAFYVVEVTDPHSPQIVGEIALVDYPSDLAMAGNYVCLANWGSGFMVIDVSDPAWPWVVGAVHGLHTDVAVAGTHAYTSDGLAGGAAVIDISNPGDPTILGSMDMPCDAYGIAASSGYAYVADLACGLLTIDATDPSNLQVVSSQRPAPRYAVAAAAEGAYVYLLSNSFAESGWPSRLHVIDAANPLGPSIMGSVGTGGGTRSVAAWETYACVADTASGLQVIDLSDPHSPAIAGGVSTPGTARGVAVSGQLACVADDSSGLQVVDISAPENPQIIGNARTTGPAVAVCLSGAYACVSVDSAGVDVIALDDPANPQRVGNVLTPGPAHGVAMSGTQAYVAADSAGLQVIDLGDPAHPHIVGSLLMPGRAWDVALWSTYVCVADGSGGLQVVDVSIPGDPRIVAAAATPAGAMGVAVFGDCAYVADDFSGLQVIALTRYPGGIVTASLQGGAVTPGNARGVAATGSFACIAGGSAGLHVLPLQCELPSTIADARAETRGCVRAAPNPTPRESSIDFDLPAAGRVRVTIHDVSGRQVRSLHSGVLSAGPHDLIWDAHDDGGRQVAPGIYLARVATADGVGTTRVVILR